MMKLAGAAMAAMLMASAAPAGAQAFNGADKIVRGDYAAAERYLRAQRALYPDSVDVLLNLAAVYAVTGRDAEAQQAYARVVAQPDQEMVMKSGESVWSHALANRAMARTVVAAR